MTAEPTLAVSANVYTSDPQAVAKAAEVLGRAVAGLAMDGISANLSVIVLEDEVSE